jgi:hypothetical protein
VSVAADTPAEVAIPDQPTDLPPTPDAVQPEQGQGQTIGEQSSAVQGEQPQGPQDDSQGLFDLGDIADPAVRSEVERIAKDIERNVNQRFQSHAEYRKQWEPYEELGLTDLDPEGVAGMLGIFEQLANPETAAEAILELAEAVGVDLGQLPEAGAEAEDIPDWARPLVENFSAEQERQLQDQIREQERERLTAEWTEVQTKHGGPLDDELAGRVKTLATRFIADPSIEQPLLAAYDFITEVAGSAEKELVRSTPKPPARAERGGSASTAIAPPETFEEAERILRERRRSLIPQ